MRNYYRDASGKYSFVDERRPYLRILYFACEKTEKSIGIRLGKIQQRKNDLAVRRINDALKLWGSKQIDAHARFVLSPVWAVDSTFDPLGLYTISPGLTRRQ